MLYMSSQSTNDGGYNLTVTFELGTNLDMAQVLVQNRVNLAMPRLPDAVKATGVSTKKKSPSILLVVNFTSDEDPTTHKPLFDQLYLSNFATIQIRDDLARLKGVGDVAYMGQQDYSMRIWLDPEKLASNNLTAGDVVNVLKEQNVQVAAGQIGQQPVPTGQDFQYTLTTLGRLVDPEQFEQIVVKTGKSGQVRPPQGCFAERAGGQESGHAVHTRRQTLDRPGDLPVAGLERTRNGRQHPGQDEGTVRVPIPQGHALQHRVRHDSVHQRIGRRSVSRAARCGDPRRDRRACCFCRTGRR